jgi:hypothetical protein
MMKGLAKLFCRGAQQKRLKRCEASLMTRDVDLGSMGSRHVQRNSWYHRQYETLDERWKVGSTRKGLPTDLGWCLLRRSADWTARILKSGWTLMVECKPLKYGTWLCDRVAALETCNTSRSFMLLPAWSTEMATVAWPLVPYPLQSPLRHFTKPSKCAIVGKIPHSVNPAKN